MPLLPGAPDLEQDGDAALHGWICPGLQLHPGGGVWLPGSAVPGAHVLGSRVQGEPGAGTQAFTVTLQHLETPPSPQTPAPETWPHHLPNPLGHGLFVSEWTALALGLWRMGARCRPSAMQAPVPRWAPG